MQSIQISFRYVGFFHAADAPSMHVSAPEPACRVWNVLHTRDIRVAALGTAKLTERTDSCYKVIKLCGPFSYFQLHKIQIQGGHLSHHVIHGRAR